MERAEMDQIAAARAGRGTRAADQIGAVYVVLAAFGLGTEDHSRIRVFGGLISERKRAA